jgi:hypothetical protein
VQHGKNLIEVPALAIAEREVDEAVLADGVNPDETDLVKTDIGLFATCKRLRVFL